MNTAQYSPRSTATQVSQAPREPQSEPMRGITTAASTQHAVMATAPTTMPMLACRALTGFSATIVMARLATATEGAAENSPENAFGVTTSLISAKTTTNAPPASPRNASTPISLMTAP